MLEPTTRRLTAPYTYKRRNPDTSRQQFPAPSSLILPSIGNIPVIVHPEIIAVDPAVVQEWARLLLGIKPNSKLSWKTGTRMDQVGSQLLVGICNAIDEYVTSKGLTPHISYELNDKGKLSLWLTALEEHMPIFYKDTIEEIGKECPKLVPLFDKAIILIGHIVHNWEELREFAKEYFEGTILPEAESCNDDKEYYEDQKARYEDIKKVGPKASPFKYEDKKAFGREVVSLKTKAGKVEANTELEALLVGWLNDVVMLLERHDSMVCLNEDYDDCHLHHYYTLPVYYSRYDALTEYHCEDLDNYFNSMSSFGAQIHFSQEIETELGEFLSDIDVLALYQRVFSFF